MCGKNDRCLAVIPARGGSKGVPKKNIRLLNGKPLIAYTIEAALESGIFDNVIVSTDSEDIADISRKYGATVPFIRPDNLSGDLVSSDDVILHAIEYYEQLGDNYKYVCKLQPTSPLRTSKHIQEAYDILKQQNSNYVVSVCECEHSPQWSGTIDEDMRLDNFIKDDFKRACRQQIEKYYRLNGAIYFGNIKQFKADKTFLGNNSLAYIMSTEESVDIDNELDFKIAEIIMKDRVIEKQ